MVTAYSQKKWTDKIEFVLSSSSSSSSTATARSVHCMFSEIRSVLTATTGGMNEAGRDERACGERGRDV